MLALTCLSAWADEFTKRDSQPVADKNLSVSVVVDLSAPRNRIPDDFLGLSFESSQLLARPDGRHEFSPDNLPLQNLLRTLGVKSLRFGGNLADSPTSPDPQIADIDPMFELARKAGSKVIYTVRLPGWCKTSAIAVNGQSVTAQTSADGYAIIRRHWNNGDLVGLNLKLEPRAVIGDHKNSGKVAFEIGPLMLAADEALLPREVGNLASFKISETDLNPLKLTPEPLPSALGSWPKELCYQVQAVSTATEGQFKINQPLTVRLIPYADAAGTGSRYAIWLPLLETTKSHL